MQLTTMYDAYPRKGVEVQWLDRAGTSADLASLREWEIAIHRWDGLDRAGAPLTILWVDWRAQSTRFGGADLSWYEIAGTATMPREPWRGGQFCGWQIEYGTGREVFCAERKALGQFACRGHYEDARTLGAKFAPGNAVGDRRAPLGAAWEPMDGGDPVPFTALELATYAPGQKP